MNIHYLSEKLNNKHYKKICSQIYYVTDHLSLDYPKHKNWYFNKHLKGIGKDREVIYITNHNNICGVAFLKKSLEEKKICTFYVTEHSRNMGIGGKLLQECFKYLETQTPLISMPKYKVHYFIYYMYKYQWRITEILPTFYNNENDEVVFNGHLQ